MPTIYLKNGESVQVKLENLEDYLYENADAIATRRKQLRRQQLGSATTSKRKQEEQ